MSLAESLQQISGFAQNGLPFDGVNLLREKITQAQGFVAVHSSGGLAVEALNQASQALTSAQEHLSSCEQMLQAARENLEATVRLVGGG